MFAVFWPLLDHVCVLLSYRACLKSGRLVAVGMAFLTASLLRFSGSMIPSASYLAPLDVQWGEMEKPPTRPHPHGHCFFWFPESIVDLLITSRTICTIVFSRFCAQIYPAALSSWNFHRTATRDSMVSGDDANAPNLLRARLKAECVKIPFCVWGDPINYLNQNESGVDIKLKSH